jgi:hypothetical protein
VTAGDDPTAEIYAAMDRAGLEATNLLATRKPMSQIVNGIRVQLAAELKQLIEDRERKEPKHIEVQTEPDTPM